MCKNKRAIGKFVFAYIENEKRIEKTKTKKKKKKKENLVFTIHVFPEYIAFISYIFSQTDIKFVHRNIHTIRHYVRAEYFVFFAQNL